LDSSRSPQPAGSASAATTIAISTVAQEVCLVLTAPPRLSLFS
jgi:hypothetical protein